MYICNVMYYSYKISSKLVQLIEQQAKTYSKACNVEQ